MDLLTKLSATGGFTPVLDYVTGELYLAPPQNLQTARTMAAAAELAEASTSLVAALAVPGLLVCMKRPGRCADLQRSAAGRKQLQALQRPVAGSKQLEVTGMQQTAATRHQMRRRRWRVCGTFSAVAALAIARALRRRALRNSIARAASLSLNSCAVAVEQGAAPATESEQKENEDLQCCHQAEIVEDEDLSPMLETTVLEPGVDTIASPSPPKRRLSLSDWWSDEARLDEDLMTPVANVQPDDSDEESVPCNEKLDLNIDSKPVPHFQLASDEEKAEANLRSPEVTPPRTSVKSWAVPDTNAYIMHRSADTGRVRNAIYSQRDAANNSSARGGS
eukprot:TRINITY_DN15766_c0_g1_i1.p1 TRINITY_DN15766_c0_g1~~TRINITY_DN15766_c0_g1_i1.p1  ORF type:complete len:335 (+),score=73.02 TRINITY_DN15766_c0_g1_i1:33-1037(+)